MLRDEYTHGYLKPRQAVSNLCQEKKKAAIKQEKAKAVTTDCALKPELLN